jgi:hypothetical protein
MFEMTVKELKELLSQYEDDDVFCAEGGSASGYEFTDVWVYHNGEMKQVFTSYQD